MFANRSDVTDGLIGRDQLPWDEDWKLDEKFFQEMKAWREQHPDSTLFHVMQKVKDAVTHGQNFIGFIPDAPFPARSLVKALSYLLSLGVVCPFAFSGDEQLLISRYQVDRQSEKRGVRFYNGGHNLAFDRRSKLRKHRGREIHGACA
jgi:hypothetical protein